MPDPDTKPGWPDADTPAGIEGQDQQVEPMDDEEKVLAGLPDVNMTALLTRDTLGG